MYCKGIIFFIVFLFINRTSVSQNVKTGVSFNNINFMSFQKMERKCLIQKKQICI